MKNLNKNNIMPKSLAKQIQEKAILDKKLSDQKLIEDKAAADLLANGDKSAADLEIEKQANSKLEADKLAANNKSTDNKKEPIKAEDVKKKHPNLNEEQIALLLELDAPVKEGEPTDNKPVVQPVNVLTAEQQAKLDLLDSILADPEKSVYFNSIKDNTLLDTLAKFIPKGEDYSKLKPKEILEKSLINDGASKEEIEKELESFDSASYYKKKEITQKALESLNKNNVSISPEYTAELKKKADKDKEIQAILSQREANATKAVETEVTSLIGKKIDGIEVTKENSVELMKVIFSNTPKMVSPQGGLDLDVRTGIENGKRIFAYDKVVPAKDKRIKQLEELVKALSEREEQRARPSLRYVDSPNNNERREPIQRASVKRYDNPFL